MSTDPVEYRPLLRQFLVEHFSLAEMKELAFDLCVSYDAFPHATAGEFAIELVGYFERRGRLRALVTKLLELRPSPSLAQILPELQGSESGYVILQMRLLSDSLTDSNEWVSKLASALGGIGIEDIHILAMAGGSVLLLLGLPAEVIEVALGLSEDEALGIDEVTHFDALSQEERVTWHWVALLRPPQRVGEALRPTIAWKAALPRPQVSPSGLGTKTERSARAISSKDTEEKLPFGKVAQILSVVAITVLIVFLARVFPTGPGSVGVPLAQALLLAAGSILLGVAFTLALWISLSLRYSEADNAGGFLGLLVIIIPLTLGLLILLRLLS
jgi:hypothetical protein